MYVLYILLASTPRINAAAVSYMSIPIVDGTSDTDPSGYKAYLTMQRYLPMDLKQANPMSCVESSFSKIRRHREKEASNIIFFFKTWQPEHENFPNVPAGKNPRQLPTSSGTPGPRHPVFGVQPPVAHIPWKLDTTGNKEMMAAMKGNVFEKSSIFRFQISLGCTRGVASSLGLKGS